MSDPPQRFVFLDLWNAAVLFLFPNWACLAGLFSQKDQNTMGTCSPHLLVNQLEDFQCTAHANNLNMYKCKNMMHVMHA